MSKKKILSLCLVIALAAVAVLGGTLAYFTDTDSATNTMTLGNVNIVQLEKDKAGEDFNQNQPLMPAVYTTAIDGSNIVENGWFNPAISNVIDKVITVENTGTEEAFVRTIIAFETKTECKEGTDEVLRDGKEIFDTYFGTLGSFTLLNRNTIKINGVEYVLAVCVYEKALAADAETDPSLKQIFLAPTAGNEVTTLFGSEYTILALSQAVQTAGFGTAAEALNAAFGDLETIDEAILIEWLSAIPAA